MLPVLTPTEMAEVDANAVESLDALIARAGFLVAREARRMLGGAYGARMHVVAGKGNNGADGRVAAELLRRAGAKVTIGEPGSAVPECAMVVDAAFGTGLSRPYAPASLPVRRPLVLAVDCPSGLDGLTGDVHGSAWRADRTLTFGSYKPGLLLNAGPGLCGSVVVESLGLDVSHAATWLVEPGDIASRRGDEPDDLHKWRRAGLMFAGSVGMTGAAVLTGRAAMRAGVRLLRVVSEAVVADPLEAVHVNGAPVLPGDVERFAAVAIGPGMGQGSERAAQVAAVVRGVRQPIVVDADGLNALGSDAAATCRTRAVPAVLTPHDGEFARMTEALVGSDRIDAARMFAADANAVVLLKGSTTVVAEPGGSVRLIAHGDERLATAGSGDVLTGVILGLLTRGDSPFEAASLGAAIHASLTHELPSSGVVAADLVEQIPGVLSLP